MLKHHLSHHSHTIQRSVSDVLINAMKTSDTLSEEQRTSLVERFPLGIPIINSCWKLIASHSLNDEDTMMDFNSEKKKTMRTPNILQLMNSPRL